MGYSSDLGVSVLVYVPQLKFNKAATKPLEQNGSLIGPYFVKKKSVFSHNLFNTRFILYKKPSYKKVSLKKSEN